MKKKVLSAILCGVIAVSMLAGCTSKTEESEEVKEETQKETETEDESVDEAKGTIKVGVAGDFYPFCFTENDETKGFEIDVLTEIGARAGYDVEFVVSDFTGIFGMLDSGKIDTVGHSVAITDERSEKYLFSEPYVYSNYNIITKKDSELKTIEDFVGKKVGVVMGGQGEVKLNELCQNENLDIEVVGYEGTAAMDEDVLMGRLDGRLGPQIQTLATIKKNNLDLAVTDVTVFFETAGYPLPKDGSHDEMQKDINAALSEMKSDGTLSELSMKWFDIDATKEK